MSNSKDEESRRVVAMALVFKASTLGSEGRFEEAIAAADDFMACYGHEPAFHSLACVALTSKCIGLISLMRFQEAITLCDDIERDYGRETNAGVRKAVAKVKEYRTRAGSGLDQTMVRDAALLVAKNFWKSGPDVADQDLLAACDTVIRNWTTSVDPETRETVAMSLLKKGTLLRRSGNAAQAIEALTDLVGQFSGDGTSGIASLVDLAREVLQLWAQVMT